MTPSVVAAEPKRAARVLVGLWAERGRLLASLAAAWLLWFLIGQRVEKTEDIECAVHYARVGDTDARASGLLVRVPDKLVVLKAQPSTVTLAIAGMREQVESLNRTLRGEYRVPEDFCDDGDVQTRAILVTSEFAFPRLDDLGSVRFENTPSIELTVTRRDTVNLALSHRNLALGASGADTIGADYEVVFKPSNIEVSGPIADIEELRRSPERLKIPMPGSLEDFVDRPASLQLRNLYLVGGDGGARSRGLLQSPAPANGVTRSDSLVEVTIRKARAWQTVQLDKVEIHPLMPESARRTDVEYPWVKITPPTLDVQVRVPEDYFAAGNNKDDIRHDLALVVNLDGMSDDSQIAKLQVWPIGLPFDPTFSPPLPTVDVQWILGSGGE